MTRVNRATADTDRDREFRDEALRTLRAALFPDADQSALFTDRETIALSRVRYWDTATLQAALDQADWARIADEATFHGALQRGLQLLDLARMRG